MRTDCLKPRRGLLLWGLLLLAAACPAARAQGRVNYADWRLEWAEEFNQPLDTVDFGRRWQFFYPWGHALLSPIETGYYTGRELHAARGVLNMTLHRLAQPISYGGKTLRYTTPLLYSRHLNDSLRPANSDSTANGFGYGLFEVRVRQPRERGTAPAFWLFGGVPDEIDAFEASPEVTTNNFHLYPGGYWRPTKTVQEECQCAYFNTDPAGNLSEQFHTYGVSWLPDGVALYFDGVPIRHETRLVPAGFPMAIILNVAAFTWSTYATDTMQVDYIRVYRPRHLPPVVPGLPSTAYLPQSELNWLPATTRPGQPDQASFQQWELAAPRRRPQQLALQLTDNHNPACDLVLPLPLGGQWAPTWQQTYGVPELRIRISAPDSVRWLVRDALGRPVAQGVVPGGGTWRPRWPELPPGTYALHLQQGAASTVQPLSLGGRLPGSGPTPAWQEPAPALPAEE